MFILLILVLLIFPPCQVDATDSGLAVHQKEHGIRSLLLYKKVNAQNKIICFTFDDGPNPYATPEILEVLDKYKIKATFFLVGTNIKKYPNIVREISERGHIIGLHSYDHPLFFILYSAQSKRNQLKKSEDLLRLLGVVSTKYFRPPNVICNKSMLQEVSEYTVVGANHYVGDNFIFSAQQIASRVLRSVRNEGGGILVLHDGAIFPFASSRRILVKALKIMIPELISQGYKFCNLDELVDSNVIVKADK